MSEQNIVPFGKYKGRLIEEVIADDPGYLEWLSGQDWFHVKYVALHQIIINRGAAPEETRGQVMGRREVAFANLDNIRGLDDRTGDFARVFSF